MARTRRWMRLVAALSVLGALALPGAALADDGDALSPELREVAEQRPLRVGWFEGAQPVAMIEDGEVVGGFAVELWELMGIKLGIEVEHVAHGSIVELVEALRSGRVDVAGMLGARPDLLEFAEATEPLAWDRLVLFGRPELSTATSVEFEGLTASTITGSPLQAVLREAVPEASFVETGAIPEALVATAAGELDLYLLTLGVGGWMNEQLGLDLGPVTGFEQVVAVSAWAPTGSDALAIARAGRSLLTPAELSLVSLRWSGFDLGTPPASDDGVPVWVQRLVVALFAVVVALGGFAALLRRRIRAATEELRLTNLELEDRVARRTSELAASNDALDRMARRAAHDLRGPLAAISGLATLVTQRDLPADSRTQAIQRMGSSATRLSELVDDLLEDAVGGRRRHMRGQEFVQWIRDVVGPEAQLAGADIEVQASPGRIPVDPVVLERVATNLVGNAVKYASNPEGTRIGVNLREVEDGWVLEVEDNGAGIPVEQREKIFDRGVRLVEDERGDGNGLADVLGLVRRAGGSVEVTEGRLGGARFRVRLTGTLDGVQGEGRVPATH